MTSFEPEIVHAESVTTAVVRRVVRVGDLREFFDTSFRGVVGTAAEQGVPLVGPAFALFRGPYGATFDMEVGFPVERAIRADGEVIASSLPTGQVARVTHAGGFDGLGDSWARLEAWLGERGLSPSGERWEAYVTEPSPDMDPADLRTELYWPLDD